MKKFFLFHSLFWNRFWEKCPSVFLYHNCFIDSCKKMYIFSFCAFELLWNCITIKLFYLKVIIFSWFLIFLSYKYLWIFLIVILTDNWYQIISTTNVVEHLKILSVLEEKDQCFLCLLPSILPMRQMLYCQKSANVLIYVVLLYIQKNISVYIQ